MSTENSGVFQFLKEMTFREILALYNSIRSYLSSLNSICQSQFTSSSWQFLRPVLHLLKNVSSENR